MRSIAILGSGGDSPGMNACLRAATRAAISRGWRIFGAYGGYQGLVDRKLVELNSRSVSRIISRGGCILGAGRCDSFLQHEVRAAAAAYLKEKGIDGLIVMGGDGSLRGATELHRLSLQVVTVPGTIDNDMVGTEITIGADTAINTAMEAIDRLRDTAEAHHRAMIVEVMGRRSGYLAVMSGLSTGAEMIITPERPVELHDIFNEMRTDGDRGKRHFIIVLAEGARWRAPELTQLINDAPNPYEARYTVLGYIQRGGSPSRFDRILATRMGVAAVDALAEGKSDALVCWRHNRVEVHPTESLQPQPSPWTENLDRVHRISTT
ncbi:MAG: 6-phosphofructokinase [SAR202 cluster bacterium]|nr:6-phosphofructokinase [SAR202 cluster bacterium]